MLVGQILVDVNQKTSLDFQPKQWLESIEQGQKKNQILDMISYYAKEWMVYEMTCWESDSEKI